MQRYISVHNLPIQNTPLLPYIVDFIAGASLWSSCVGLKMIFLWMHKEWGSSMLTLCSLDYCRSCSTAKYKELYACLFLPVIFFDLDDTLTNKDANTLWIKWRANTSAGRWWRVYWRCFRCIAPIKGKITHGRLSQYYRTKAYGLTVDEYQERVEQFF